MTVLQILAGIALLSCVAAFEMIRRRDVMRWLPGYFRARLQRQSSDARPIHIMFCFVDHFEPGWKQPGYAIEAARVERWCREYPRLAGKFKDADGLHPKHTFFYPEEEYREEHLDKLAALCAAGFGEIEVHLHHDQDTSEGLREKLVRFVEVLSRRHGALSADPLTGRPRWGFIHGNWALDNSRPDGRWCGVNDELLVLSQCGCYADFTLPSAPSPTQTSTVNAIYYATDDPGKPKSHDRGAAVTAGQPARGDLMIIQGILGLSWSSRKFGVLPRIENSDVRAGQPPSESRIDQWVRLAPTVRNQPDWRFIKIHTHGAPELQETALLGRPAEQMYEYLTSRYNDGRNYVLHFVSAREMFNIIKAAEAGHGGNPAAYRDTPLPLPSFIRQDQPSDVRF